MIRTDQAPWFDTHHVIRGLTAKFNRNRVKVYHLDMFCLANLHINMILNAEEEVKIWTCALLSMCVQAERELCHISVMP